MGVRNYIESSSCTISEREDLQIKIHYRKKHDPDDEEWPAFPW